MASRNYVYSNAEFVAMVQLYAIAGFDAQAARRRYSEPNHLQSLRRRGIPNPQVPAGQTIMAATQRLLDHGQFRTPKHAQGRGREPVYEALQDEEILEKFERDPRRRTNNAAISFNQQKTVAEKAPGEVIKVFCPKCKSEVSHTAEGIQMDQKDQLIAKVYHYFEQEYEELKKTIPGIEQSALSLIGQRTALATGVSETTVAEVLEEEARRSEVVLKQEAREKEELRQATLLEERQARRTPKQEDSSGEECNYGSDEDDDDYFEATETLVIKEEPLESDYEEPAFLDLPSVKEDPDSSEESKELVDPIFIDINKEPGLKTEPTDEEATTIETLVVKEEPLEPNNSDDTAVQRATTSIRKRKITVKTEAPPAASAPPSTSASPTTPSSPKRRLILLDDSTVKVEKIEIDQEGNS